ncbi:type III secretion system inner membrane ring lipoprotein SctJ [Shewanella sp. SR44-3]|uniref:type III secretion system inner membrane ring lipoprotein SctJ n=1 Tax=unclassified Shewanella TaxID=196818 RepID=UPI0015FE0807|nr:type III secretion inner membrane ring lipoprotein SctJ [Shewanella sp. SR44-3]MBB1269007.1 type III secretion inner membrane ring lipoprotein SctJ [Shewanella sp. SR44-3]
MMNSFLKIALISCLLVLSGCKTELYNGLSQKEGNEMLAILLVAGISTEKLPDSDERIKLMVEESQLSLALATLKSQGYPKDKFASLGEVFPDEGLISSPLEERARLMFAKSQEISSTLSQIDGVITARVHIVKPQEEKIRGRNKEITSSASVFIKHAPNIDIESLVPQIKLLVNNSIEGLNYDRISVILVPAIESRLISNQQKLVTVLSLKMAATSEQRFIGLLTFFMIILLGTNIATYLWSKKQSGQ